MDAQRFDRITKSLSTEMTRGRAVKTLLTAGAGGVLALVGTRETVASEFCSRQRRNGRAFCTSQVGANGARFKLCLAEYMASFGCSSTGGPN